MPSTLPPAPPRNNSLRGKPGPPNSVRERPQVALVSQLLQRLGEAPLESAAVALLVVRRGDALLVGVVRELLDHLVACFLAEVGIRQQGAFVDAGPGRGGIAAVLAVAVDLGADRQEVPQ